MVNYEIKILLEHLAIKAAVMGLATRGYNNV